MSECQHKTQLLNRIVTNHGTKYQSHVPGRSLPLTAMCRPTKYRPFPMTDTIELTRHVFSSFFFTLGDAKD